MWPGRGADPSHSSSAVVKKEKSYTSTPTMGLTACTGPLPVQGRTLPFLDSPICLLLDCS